VDRIFLDANVLFSAAYRADAGVARLWTLDGCVLLTSDYAAEEARRNLQGPDQLARLEELLELLTTVPTVTLPPGLRGEVQLPEKDWPILGGAISAGATHLITGDKRDFGPYFGTELLGVLILPPGDYLSRRGHGAP
jgi:predicted nucleic acid-binding protein